MIYYGAPQGPKGPPRVQYCPALTPTPLPTPWPGSNLNLDLHLPVTGKCKSQVKICLGAFWADKPMVVWMGAPLPLATRPLPPSEAAGPRSSRGAKHV